MRRKRKLETWKRKGYEKVFRRKFSESLQVYKNIIKRSCPILKERIKSQLSVLRRKQFLCSFLFPSLFSLSFLLISTNNNGKDRARGRWNQQPRSLWVHPSQFQSLPLLLSTLSLSLYNNILQAYTILNIGTYLVSNFVLPSLSLLFSFSSCEYLSFIFCPPKINAFSTWHRYCYISQTLVVWVVNGLIILWVRVFSLTWANLSQNYSF